MRVSFFAITDFFDLSLLNPSFDKSFLKSPFVSLEKEKSLESGFSPVLFS